MGAMVWRQRQLTNGHRYDTGAIANGLISSGMSCESVSYRWASTQILRHLGQSYELHDGAEAGVAHP